MFGKKCFLILFCLIQGAYFMDMRPKTSDNYGPYEIEVKSFEVLKGPKQKSIAVFNFSLTKENGDYFSHCNLTFLEQGRFEEAKVTVYSVKDSRKTVLWTYRMKELCTHFTMAPIIEHYMHAKNCVVKKGVFIIDMNYSETIRKFFGTSFFYGDYTFRIYIFSKTGNILSLSINQSFTKKKSGN